MVRILRAFAGVFLLLLPVPAAADELFQPRIETGLKYGSKRSIGAAEVWIPVTQGYDRVLYADFRVMLDDQENREANGGLGYRQIVPFFGHEVIAGGHAWLDRRITRYDSTFHQATLGGELLGRDWDLRLNAYVPLNDEKLHVTPVTGSSTPYLAGTGIFYDTTGLLLEEPQPGADIEVGRRIPLFADYVDSLRAYVGGYHFTGDVTDNVSGGRVRLVADITPDFSLGGRFQHDNERGSQGFIEATLRFPFTSKRSFAREGLRARLDESPERDVDIVTGGRVLDTGIAKPVLAAETGTQQRVLHVDNTAASGGDGSKETPYNTLKAAEAQLQAHDVLYIHAGDGTTTGQDEGLIINKPNITIIGSGVDFIYDAGKFTTSTPGNLAGTILAQATTAPVITNLEDSNGDNSLGVGVLVSADQASIHGLSFYNTTSGHSIYAPNNSGTVWQDITISNIASTYASGISGETIRIQALAAGSVIENISIRDIQVNRDTATSRNINITASLGRIENFEISGVEMTGATQGFNIVAQNGGYIGKGILEDIDVRGATTGILVAAQTPDSNIPQQGIGELVIKDVVADGNGQHISVGANNMPIGKISIVNVEATNNNPSNGTNGINISASNTNGYIGEVRVDGLLASGNRQNGLRIASANTAIIGPVVVQNSIFTGNGQYGISINDNSTTALNIDLGGGTLGSVGHNSIHGNGISNPATYGDLQLDLDGSLTPLPAQYNWWGQAGGPVSGQIRSVGAGSPPSANTGTADASYALDTTPIN